MLLLKDLFRLEKAALISSICMETLLDNTLPMLVTISVDLAMDKDVAFDKIVATSRELAMDKAVVFSKISSKTFSNSLDILKDRSFDRLLKVSVEDVCIEVVSAEDLALRTSISELILDTCTNARTEILKLAIVKRDSAVASKSRITCCLDNMKQLVAFLFLAGRGSTL